MQELENFDFRDKALAVFENTAKELHLSITDMLLKAVLHFHKRLKEKRNTEKQITL